jgi:hypothetical protein
VGHALVLIVLIGSAIVVGSALRPDDAQPLGVAAPIEQPRIVGGASKHPRPLLPYPSEYLSPTSGLRHPGVFVSLPQLEIVRDRVIAGRQPWKRAYDQMRNSPYASFEWDPQPREVVECGYYSNPDLGCRDEWRDATAAYTHALLWYFTGREAHAHKAIGIIDAWSGVLKAHTNANRVLQAGWSAAMMVRAAEILRYGYTGWSESRVKRAEDMFRNVYLPSIRNAPPRGSEGNWDLIMLDGAIGIAVFLDDRELFDQLIGRWRARVPAYIYHSSDGPWPVAPPGGVASLTRYWHGQTTYVDGLVQETCRDLGHTAWGLEALAHVAETAWIQGIDLYAEAQPRLLAALEFHAGLALGDPVPGWLCGGTLAGLFSPIPENAYNHYHHRLGIEMPRTEQLIAQGRPQRASFFYAWTTLTSVNVP